MARLSVQKRVGNLCLPLDARCCELTWLTCMCRANGSKRATTVPLNVAMRAALDIQRRARRSSHRAPGDAWPHISISRLGMKKWKRKSCASSCGRSTKALSCQ